METKNDDGRTLVKVFTCHKIHHTRHETVRAWRPYADQETTAKREEPHALRSAYQCMWS